MFVSIFLACFAMSQPSQRLRVLSAVGGVSDSALSRILAAVKSNPEILSDDCGRSRRTIARRANEHALAAGMVKHMIKLTEGPPLEWPVFTTQALLPYLCKASTHFLGALKEIYKTHGADWRSVLYCDGLTPGNVLAPEIRRKTIIWYFSLLEFDTKLCHQELWSTIAIVKTDCAKLVPGGVSALTRLILRDMVCGDRAVNTVGLILPVGEDGRLEMVRIHAHAILADEEALSAMFGLKGSGGMVPCAARCWCVSKPTFCDKARGIAPITTRGAGIVDITCRTKSDITFKTDADVVGLRLSRNESARQQLQRDSEVCWYQLPP